jgi:Raf kinase inhibitor-like YbhB/YbcL family protein
MSVCATAVLILACAAPSKSSTPATAGDTTAVGMALASTAFEEGEPVPVKYSGYGNNVSPELSWNEAPEGTKSFALICRDPDAPVGTFYHWVVFNIPDTVKRLPEGLGRDSLLPSGGLQGTNSFRKVGYDGPKPPSGTHRYYFDLYALDGAVDLDRTATAGRLLEAIEGHVLAKGSLMGRYKK